MCGEWTWGRWEPSRLAGAEWTGCHSAPMHTLRPARPPGWSECWAWPCPHPSGPRLPPDPVMAHGWTPVGASQGCEPALSGAPISLSGVRMGGGGPCWPLSLPRGTQALPWPWILHPCLLLRPLNEGLPSRVLWRGLLDRGTRRAGKEGGGESPYPPRSPPSVAASQTLWELLC